MQTSLQQSIHNVILACYKQDYVEPVVLRWRCADAVLNHFVVQEMEQEQTVVNVSHTYLYDILGTAVAECD